jgi:predicted FMN-binding regulatory protein PaiB
MFHVRQPPGKEGSRPADGGCPHSRTAQNVRRLREPHAGEPERPWSVDDAPAGYIARQLRAIVGIELILSRIEAQAKLSQNRSPGDIDGVIGGTDRGRRPGDHRRRFVAPARHRRGDTGDRGLLHLLPRSCS